VHLKKWADHIKVANFLFPSPTEPLKVKHPKIQTIIDFYYLGWLKIEIVKTLQ
jgi:hypothetical protein